MDNEIELVEDPYLGLRIEQAKVREIEARVIRIKCMPVISGAQGPSMLDIWSDIGEFLRTIGGYLNPLTWYQWLYDKAIGPMIAWMREHIFAPLSEQWSRLQGAFLGWWENPIHRIEAVIANITGAIGAKVSDLVAAIKERLQGLIDNILLAVRELRNRITENINTLIDRFRTFIENVKDAIHDRITVLIARIVDTARELRERLGAFFGNLIERIRVSLSELKERVWDAIMEWVRRMEAALERRFRDIWDRIVAAIRDWWNKHAPQILEAADKAIKIARPYVEKWVGEFEKLPGSFLEWVARIGGTNLALNPGRSLAVVGSLYAMSIGAGTLAQTVATALNIIPGTNWVGASQFSAYIAQVAGFDLISRASYGVLLNEVLAIPLRYYWNYQLRPKLPTEGEIFIMGRKHGIDYDQFKLAMGYMGIPDTWIDLMYDFFWTDPSPMWRLRMTEGGIPKITSPGRKLPWLNKWLPGWENDDLAWLKMKLMLAGYEDIDIAPMIEGMQRRGLISPTTQVKTSVRAMRREAYWTDDQVREALLPLGVRPQEIQYIITAEELDYQNKYMDEQVKLYVDAFSKEEIDINDLRIALSTIIVKPERVEQIVTREQIRKLPKPKPPAAPKEDPEVAKVRAEKIASHIAMFRKRLIGPEELYTYLLADGLSKALARATAIKETVSRIKAPPLDSPYFLSDALQRLLRENIAEYDDLWKEGKITIGEYLKALMALGLDEDTATYLADVAILERFLGILPSVELL